MKDHGFSVLLHGDPRLVDIVDLKWATQKLDLDEIQVSVEEKPKSLEEDLDDDIETEDHDKWNETLQFFECIN
jgi:hypothetical protein